MAGIPASGTPAPYAAGDPWTAEDASLFADSAIGLFDALILRHDKADGTHRDPRIPVAAALVTVAGTTPTLRASHNVSGVSRTGAGDYKIDLSITLVADAWGAEVCPSLSETLYFGSYHTPSTTIAVNVHLASAAGVAADTSFLVLVYGEVA